MTIAIAEVPVELGPGHNVVELKLRAPGIVRAAGIWLKTPAVLGAASMRAVEKVAMPLLFVECSPTGELQDRTFVFLSSGQQYAPRDGLMAVHRATAIGQAGALHVYEIVASKSPVCPQCGGCGSAFPIADGVTHVVECPRCWGTGVAR